MLIEDVVDDVVVLLKDWQHVQANWLVMDAKLRFVKARALARAIRAVVEHPDSMEE